MMQQFATPAPVTAIIAIPAGRIQVTAADRADTTVEIRPADPAKGRDVKLAAAAIHPGGDLGVGSETLRRVSAARPLRDGLHAYGNIWRGA
jgi:hypothetical protein